MTAFWFMAAVALPCWGTYALVTAASRSLPRTVANTVLRCALAAGIGLGWASGTCFLWLVAFGRPQAMYLAVDTLFWFLVAFLVRPDRTPGSVPLKLPGCRLDSLFARRVPHIPDRRVSEGGSATDPFAARSDRSSSENCPSLARRAGVDDSGDFLRRLHRALAIAFGAILLVALIGMVGQALAESNGGWDAWAIWNLRARYLYRLGDDWPQALTGVFPHPDYPLLVPASLARLWIFLGFDSAWGGAALGIGYTLATVAVVAAAISHRRSAGAGMLASIILLATPRFLRWGALQYADVPLSFYFLATLVLLKQRDALPREPDNDSRAGLLLLAGMTTGLAAWTKNEGLLFAAIILLFVPAVAGWRRGWKSGLREGLLVLTGTVPALGLVLLFKAHVPASNDLVAGQGLAATIGRVFDPARHLQIVLASLTTGIQVANAFAAAIPVCFLLLGRTRPAERSAGDWVLPAGVIGLMCAGYYGIYLTTPHDLGWHLATSLDRLIVQLWPMIVFAVFLQLRSPEEVVAEAYAVTAPKKSRAPSETDDLRRAA